MFNVVEKKIPNIDAWEKAVGRAQYTIDKKLPNMLIGKVFRSSIANARIKHININQALKVPGVKCILTGKDCPGNKYGPIINDQYILPVDNRVRFVGDEIAAVAAINEEVANEAISFDNLLPGKKKRLKIIKNYNF